MGFFGKLANVATGGVYGAIKNRRKPGGILRSLASGGVLGGGRPSPQRPQGPAQPGPPSFGQVPGLPSAARHPADSIDYSQVDAWRTQTGAAPVDPNRNRTDGRTNAFNNLHELFEYKKWLKNQQAAPAPAPGGGGGPGGPRGHGRGAFAPMPGPAQPGPEQMPPQTGGPEPRPEMAPPSLPQGPGQYGGFNPPGRRPGGSVFGDPWGGFGG